MEEKVNLNISDGDVFFAHELSINFNPMQFIFDFKSITPRVDPRSQTKASISLKHNVVMVDNGGNLGKGAALRAGFARAKGDIVVTMDADGSHHPEDIPRIVYPMINGYDIDATIGSRFVDDIGKNSTTKLHLIGNKIINALILFLTGRYISDTQSGFRAFRQNAVKKLALSSSRYEIESEITIKMLKNGFRIREIPIRCKQRKSGSTKIGSFGDGFNILKTILKATFCS